MGIQWYYGMIGRQTIHWHYLKCTLRCTQCPESSVGLHSSFKVAQDNNNSLLRYDIHWLFEHNRSHEFMIILLWVINGADKGNHPMITLEASFIVSLLDVLER